MKRRVFLLALAVLLAACGREAATRKVDDLVIMLSADTRDGRVGEVVVRAKIADRAGALFRHPRFGSTTTRLWIG